MLTPLVKNRCSEVISQDSIYVPKDGKDYRAVETDFYVQGNPKAARKWTQLEEKVQNLENEIVTKDMAIHYAALMNYLDSN